jgi:ParB family transcriptional regulator, chromosome partitioning protein
VLEPLLVTRVSGGRWMIVAGERRWRAARAAGLREVPCIEVDVDESSIAEIALIENMQRKDLTAWEEADGLFALCFKYGYTHDDVAKKIGKSRTSVTEALSIAALPEEVREECRRAHIDAKSTLIQIARQSDLNSMLAFIGEVARKGLKRDEVRIARKAASIKVSGKNKEEMNAKSGVTFKYDSDDGMVRLELHFKEKSAEAKDVIPTLKAFLAALEAEQDAQATWALN